MHLGEENDFADAGFLPHCPRGQPLPKSVTVRLGFLGGLKLSPNWENLFIVLHIGPTLDRSEGM